MRETDHLDPCNPVGACETHGRCWTHSAWLKCGSLIQSVSSDPCEAVVDGLDGLCGGCREFKAMLEQHDEVDAAKFCGACGRCTRCRAEGPDCEAYQDDNPPFSNPVNAQSRNKHMKIHKVTILIVDHDNLGVAGVKTELENANFPNDCIHPTVVEIDTREVEWSDDHPLNKFRTRHAEFHRLFGAEDTK